MGESEEADAAVLMAFGMMTLRWAWCENSVALCLMNAQNAGLDIKERDGFPAVSISRRLKRLKVIIKTEPRLQSYQGAFAHLVERLVTLGKLRHRYVHTSVVPGYSVRGADFFNEGSVLVGAQRNFNIVEVFQLNQDLAALGADLVDFAVVIDRALKG